MFLARLFKSISTVNRDDIEDTISKVSPTSTAATTSIDQNITTSQTETTNDTNINKVTNIKTNNGNNDKCHDKIVNQTSSSNTISKKSPNISDSDTLYQHYKKLDDDEKGQVQEDEEIEDSIGASGLMALTMDLGLEEDDIGLLILAYKWKCATPYVITKKEWQKGCSELGIHNVQTMRNCIQKCGNEIYQNQVSLRKFYMYAFNYNKQTGQKSIAPELAIPTWKMLLNTKYYAGGTSYRYLDHWCDFVEYEYKKAISKDTWTQFFDFIREYQKKDLQTYNPDDGAWPVAIDDFVEYWVKKNVNQ